MSDSESSKGSDPRTRLLALEEFATRLREELHVGTLAWDSETPNLRALAVNHCIRRQQDALKGAVALGRAGEGHLAVAFVRAFFDERIWIGFLARMSASEARRLLLALGRWDTIRSLVAQRRFVGDLAMSVNLWYPPGFVDDLESTLPRIQGELRGLRTRWGWDGKLPSAAWVADQVSLRQEYNYLHSATSRALHFSAGESLRRGWGTRDGILTTRKAEFLAHLEEFAYDQLWRQHLGTLEQGAEILQEAGVNARVDFFTEESRATLVGSLQSLGEVPLVHAAEYNLSQPSPLTTIVWKMMLTDESSEACHPGPDLN